MNVNPDVNPTESAWDFACRVYQKNGVAEACIQLQDQYNINIPLLLFCCWVSQYCAEFSRQSLEKIEGFSMSYAQQTTLPLRNIRREMKKVNTSDWPISKDEWDGLREQVKKTELESERVLLSALQNIIKEPLLLNQLNQSERFSASVALVGRVVNRDRAAQVDIQKLIDLIYKE